VVHLFEQHGIIVVLRRWSLQMQTELSSFLIEITALIFKKKDEDGKSYILDSILDKTGMKGTGADLSLLTPCGLWSCSSTKCCLLLGSLSF